MLIVKEGFSKSLNSCLTKEFRNYYEKSGYFKKKILKLYCPFVGQSYHYLHQLNHIP